MGGWFTLAVGGARSCVGLKQQTSITEHTQTILPSSWCASRVVFLYNVPDLKRIENILKRAWEGYRKLNLSLSVNYVVESQAEATKCDLVHFHIFETCREITFFCVRRCLLFRMYTPLSTATSPTLEFGFPVTLRPNIRRGSYDGLGLVDSSFS